jgi:hypothetical protein
LGAPATLPVVAPPPAPPSPPASSSGLEGLAANPLLNGILDGFVAWGVLTRAGVDRVSAVDGAVTVGMIGYVASGIMAKRTCAPTAFDQTPAGALVAKLTSPIPYALIKGGAVYLLARLGKAGSEKSLRAAATPALLALVGGYLSKKVLDESCRAERLSKVAVQAQQIVSGGNPPPTNG